MILGLRTVVYPVTDLAQARTWYADLLAVQPYFDEPFYVGFNVGGFELGLDPDTSALKPGSAGGLAYWGVPEIRAALDRAVELGATELSEPREVGGGIKVAEIRDPFGNAIGLIENPQFDRAAVR
jgi:predicted enzyme related to lactoylglutathione lyase